MNFKTSLVFIVVVICIPVSVICDQDSQCNLCFQNAAYAKYCMYGMESSNGKCCLYGSGDNCLMSNFFCTDAITDSFTYHKYAYCSFNGTLCGSSKRTLLSKQTPLTIYTSLDLSPFDVCPYYIVADTDLPFNALVQITLNKAVNADVYLLLGGSLDSIQS